MDEDVNDSRSYGVQASALQQELARLQRERRAHCVNRGRLERMLETYHQRHMSMARMSAVEAQRFRRLHERLAEAVGAQAELVGRLSRVMRARHAC